MQTNPFAREFYGVAEDKGPDLRENFSRFIDHLRRRRERAEPIGVVIDGRETGVGKSALAITIARELDPGFSLDSIIYSAAELYRLYETRPPGSIALYDESVLGLLSRKGSRDDELSGLIGALSIVRKNGLGTILCVPKLMMLDSIVVNGLVPHYIFVEARGRARVHRVYKGAQYRKSRPRIPYDLWTEVSPMTWRNLDRDPFFQDYKARAVERNREFFREQQVISERKRRRLLGDYAEVAGDNVSDRGLSSPPPQSCPQCSRTFSRPDVLRRHLVYSHGGAKK
jgi:hypothetical protein